MADKDIVRDIAAILSTHEKGTAGQNVRTAKYIIKKVKRHLTSRAADLPKLCANCRANHGDSTCEEYQSMLAANR